jgi:hypothetical protein
MIVDRKWSDPESAEMHGIRASVLYRLGQPKRAQIEEDSAQSVNRTKELSPAKPLHLQCQITLRRTK